jgi:putative ABC transport system substrate-binding protein
MSLRCWSMAIALFCALPAAAQPRVVGVMTLDPDSSRAGWEELLAGGLRKLGYRDARTLRIEYRFAGGDLSRYPALARELMAQKPALVVTQCSGSQRAIRDLAPTLPIIAFCADEINFLGEVATLARPGGNTTGILVLSAEAVGKKIELLREIRPGLARIAVLYDANDPIPKIQRELDRVQAALGLMLERIAIERPEQLEGAFARMERGRAQAVFVVADTRMLAEHARIADLAKKHRLPAVFEYSYGADAGFLLTYGANVAEFVGTTVPYYVDRILKGAKAGDLPVVQPSKFEMTVNLKTAREIGIVIPQSVLGRADRVIE